MWGMLSRKEYHRLYGIWHYKEHKKEILVYVKNWQKTNPNKIKDYLKRSKIKRKIQMQKNYQRQKLLNPEKKRERDRKWKKENPRSGNHVSYELQEAMLNVRIRDKNTCQWAKCGLTNKEARIDVHHIFPKNEYPDLELVEQYMICYCSFHHRSWHKSRGDSYAEMIHPIKTKT